MEKYKQYSQICEPDERQKIFVRFGPAGIEPKTLKHIYEALEELEISESVPEEIRSAFNVACNIYLYSWFAYGFIPVAVLHSYGTIELALKLKAGKIAEGKGLKWCLRHAIDRGWIKDEGFRLHRAAQARREEYYQVMEKMGRPIKREIHGPQMYCRILLDTIPEFRNSHAHGHAKVYPWGFPQMEICADLINQLFVPSKNPPPL